LLHSKVQRSIFQKFNELFWNEELGFYAYTLDGDKKPVFSVASNPGHCLWSGIVPKDRAARVVARLMQPDMWSGWGIRTLSASHKSFNPYNYQTGAVWPRDNAIIALGFRRDGFAAEAGGRKFTSQVAGIATTWAGQYRLGALSRTPRDCSQRQKSRHRLWPSAA
jgi:glycogen debranching enzyme